MKTEVKNKSKTEIELTVTVEADTAKNEYLKSLKKIKRFAVIPGFRKGKAPLSLVENSYADYVKEEFIEKLKNDYYTEALKAEKLNPVNEAESQVEEWSKGKPLTIKYLFEVMPEIKIEKYKNMEIPFEKAEFEESHVEEAIEHYQQQTATEEEIDKAKEGCLMEIEINFLDENGEIYKSIDRNIKLGHNHYGKELNKKLLNSKIGDEIKTKLFDTEAKSTDNDIPDNMKNREFLVRVTKISRKILPKIDDEFAKDLDYDNLEELKKTIRKELKQKIRKQNDDAKKTAIYNKLIEENPFELPKSMVRNYAADIAKRQAQQYQIDYEKLIPAFTETAVFNIKSFYIVEKIKERENIEVSDEDREKLAEKAAQNLDMELDKYKKLYDKQIKSDDFKRKIIEEKIIDLIEESSTFIPYPDEEKQPENQEEKVETKE